MIFVLWVSVERIGSDKPTISIKKNAAWIKSSGILLLKIIHNLIIIGVFNVSFYCNKLAFELTEINEL